MKILCIVQARMGSERLEGKVLRTLLGKPMILHTLDRLSKCKYIDEIILATSEEEKEQPLVDTVKSAGYSVFRGNESNVLKRYKDAADMYSGDIIIRVTGDCPLIDWNIVDNVITNYKMYGYDYVRLDVPNTFIRGFDVEIFSKEALERAYSIVHNEKQLKKIETDINLMGMYKEHVTLYMYKHPKDFSIGFVKGEGLYKKNYRLCVDTVEDFQLVTEIYEHFKDEFVSAKEVISLLDDNKEIAEINLGIVQKKF